MCYKAYKLHSVKCLECMEIIYFISMLTGKWKNFFGKIFQKNFPVLFPSPTIYSVCYFSFYMQLLKTVLLLEEISEISERNFRKIDFPCFYRHTFPKYFWTTSYHYLRFWKSQISRLSPSITIFTIKPPCSEGPRFWFPLQTQARPSPSDVT